jgi:hypothetical protein
MDIVLIGHCFMPSGFLFFLTFTLFIFVLAEMECSNTSSLHLYRDFWLVQMPGLYLSPGSLEFADILATAQVFATMQTLFVILAVAFAYYYIVLPMNYVKVSH